MRNTWVELELEVVTPMFIDGPRDSQRNDELIRATTFKNALRRGLALALPHLMPDSTRRQLLDTIFGQASDNHPVATTSLIAVRTTPRDLRVAAAGSSTAGLYAAPAPALDYLLGLGLGKSTRDGARLTRPCLRPGSTLRLELRARRRHPHVGDPLLLALIGLRCLELFGGVGAHTSRGWGAFRVTSDAQEWKDARRLVPGWPTPGAQADVAAWVAPLIRTLQRQLPAFDLTGLDPDRDDAFDLRSRTLESANVYTRRGPYPSALAALSDAGRYLQQLRRPVPAANNRGTRTWEWTKHRTPAPSPGGRDTVDNAPIAALAMPIQYYRVDTRQTYTLNYSPGRFPSVLHLRPVRVGQGWTWGSLFFNDWPDVDSGAPDTPQAAWSLASQTDAATIVPSVRIGRSAHASLDGYCDIWHDGLDRFGNASAFGEYVHERLTDADWA